MIRRIIDIRNMWVSHVAVAVIVAMLTVILYDLNNFPSDPTAFLLSKAHGAMWQFVSSWLLGMPDGESNAEHQIDTPGYGLVVSPQGEVLFSQGEALCRAGEVLKDCAPELVGVPDGERYVEVNGAQVAQLAQTTIFGERFISMRTMLTYGQRLNGAFYLHGGAMIIAWGALLAGLCALPLSLLATRLVAVPQARRLTHIATMSRALADGDYRARVNDQRSDDIGDLARQVDDMADVLQQNVTALHDLNANNDALVHQAEQSAVQAERLRLSRDLHDSTAQGLFTLSLLTATMPDLVRDDAAAAKEKVTKLVALSDSVRAELEAMLVDLRPASVIQLGLPGAVERLCLDWEIEHNLPVTCSLAVYTVDIPDKVQDTIYRVLQESLNNVAKHAQAKSVSVSLLVTRQKIALSVSDDGCGFDSKAQTGHFGIMGMRERSAVLGAEFLIESESMRGTTVQWTSGLEGQKE